MFGLSRKMKNPNANLTIKQRHIIWLLNQLWILTEQ